MQPHFITKLAPFKFQWAENGKVALFSLKYFQALNNLIKETPNKTIVNFIIWRIIDSYASYLGYPKKYSHDPRPHASKCSELAMKKLPISINAFWLRKYFSINSKPAVEQIAVSVKKHFKQILKSNRWMDERTKKKAILKLDKMTPVIAYYDELLNDKKLSERFKNFKIDESKFFETILELNKIDFNETFKIIHDNTKELDWVENLTVAVANAFYSIITNSISKNILEIIKKVLDFR